MTPLLVALLLAAGPSDTVYTVDGGRIAGTVVEESPTAGVTIQLPDGSIRRIERGDVARIEFSDGTVTTLRPTQAPAPAPAPAAAPAAGPLDAISFAGGGRVRGTVIEENPRAGVKVRLLDGSVHTYATEDVTRIDYADGTVSTPHAPRAAEAAAVAAPHAPGELPLDTVYFMGSGRVRGTVIEENPKTGVKVRLLDGTVQTYSREELVRIVYADGSVSSRKVPPAAPPPQAQPQPAFVPPPPPPEDKGPMGPIYIAAGVGVTFVGGDAAAGVPMQNVFDPQAHLSGEIGLRFSPAWAIGVYGDAGGGDVTGPVHDQCQAQMVDCVGYTGRIGVLLRHTWDPATPVAKWLSLGTGWEVGGVTLDHHGGNQPDLFTYTGREYGRIGAGVDFRSNRVVALGMYGSFAIGEYDKYKDPTGTTSLDRRYHTTGELGIRLTLFP